MKNLMKVFLSCAFGAFIGTRLVLQIFELQVNPGFRWLGYITGFLVGYLDYNFRLEYKFLEVIAATPSFWGAMGEILDNDRFVCGNGALLGASAGYHYNNAFIGALIGGLFGIIAIVLLRILHVASARSK